VTILELEKNLWERVDNVVRCGYIEDMENKQLTKTQFNTTIVSMRELLQCVKASDSPTEQIEFLRIIANAANSVANRLENK
jgi:hypothetical protein